MSGSTAQQPRGQAGQSTQQQSAARLAEKADSLADRQEKVHKQLKSLDQADLESVAAGKQEDVKAQTRDLSDAVENVAELISGVSGDDESRHQARRAADALRKASQAQQSAESAMSQGRPAEAASQQKQAASALTQAGDALDSLADRLSEQADESGQGDAPIAADQTAESLAEGYEQASQASQTPTPSAAQKAAAAMAQAARSAAAQARQAGVTPSAIPGMSAAQAQGQGQGEGQGEGQGQGQGQGEGQGQASGQPGSTADSKMGVGAMSTDARDAQLGKMGLSPRDWARLPGKLKNEILQAAGEDVPESYRPYVKRYFRAMSRTRDDAKKPSGK